MERILNQPSSCNVHKLHPRLTEMSQVYQRVILLQEKELKLQSKLFQMMSGIGRTDETC